MRAVHRPESKNYHLLRHKNYRLVTALKSPFFSMTMMMFNEAISL